MTTQIQRSVPPPADIIDSESRHSELQELLRKALDVRPNHDIELIARAYHASELAHRGQCRQSGDPYITHILAVGRILIDLNQDSTTVAAGLLHDIVRNTGIPLSQIRAEFSDEIATLVDSVTKIRDLGFQTPGAEQAENFRKLLLTMARDIRVVLIKFADRLHNMRTLEALDPDIQRRMAQESRDIYAPLAQRLGISRIREALEDLSLKWLEPAAYRSIQEKINLSREEREAYLDQVRQPLRKMLEKAGIRADIQGRPKSFYSIYQKMKRFEMPFEEMYDLQAVRIIVDTLPDCYHALGLVHSMYTPVMSRFKDFIATPKSNMYQSLHTTIIGPGGMMLEVQIRTAEMHQTAEVGIAAHWLYKEGKSGPSDLDRQMAWLRERIREWQNETEHPDEFIEELKTDLFPDEVYVFTPKGDLIQLPEGSTPIDFAFAVHTEVGFRCIGARVNGQMLPLAKPLQTGSTVEIITSPHQRPSRDWLNIVRSSKARARIRRWLREAEHAHSVRLGQEILEREIKKRKKCVSEEDLQQAAADLLGKLDVEHLHAAIGNGDISMGKVIHKLFPKARSPQWKTRPGASRPRRGSALKIHGLNNLMVHYARCCRPIPGDPILGIITRGRGVSVHRRDCPNIRTEEQERILEVDWERQQEDLYTVQIQVSGTDRPNFLQDVTRAIGESGAPIIDGELKTANGEARDLFTIQIGNRNQLAQLTKNVMAVPGATDVQRMDNVPEKDRAHRS